MAAETREHRPQPSRDLDLRRPDTGKVLSGGVHVLKHEPRMMGEIMVRTYIGPTPNSADTRDTVLNLAVLEPWDKHLDKEFSPAQIPSIIFPLTADQPSAANDDAITNAVWDKYMGKKGGTITLLGKHDTRNAFYANRDTLQAMAEGKIPTPPDMEDVVNAYKKSPEKGQRAFEVFYGMSTDPRKF